MVKPPGGREKPWHQDAAFFKYPSTVPIVGVWVALSKVSRDNGCMCVLLPSNHPRTDATVPTGVFPHFQRRDWQICDMDIQKLEPSAAAIEMEPGDILFFSSLLPHGTRINTSDSHRWAVQLHYVDASAVEASDTERLQTFGPGVDNVTC